MFVFHPGSPKTGTTYLQRVVFPQWGKVVMGYFDIRALEAPNVFYSDESLWRKERWDYVLKWAHVADKVIVGTRNPDENAASWGKSLVEAGYSEEYAADLAAQYDFCNTYAKAAQLKDLYGDKVFVYDFDELRRSPSLLIERMASFLGVEMIPNLSISPVNEHKAAWRAKLMVRLASLYPREKIDGLPPIRRAICFRIWNAARHIIIQP